VPIAKTVEIQSELMLENDIRYFYEWLLTFVSDGELYERVVEQNESFSTGTSIAKF
jgi:hypothetical protein